MTFAVAFAMCSAYILSRTLVPACSANWLKGHAADHGHARAEDASAGLSRWISEWEWQRSRPVRETF